MPKLGMEPIRREQICRASAKVIATHGFGGTTMRMVAEAAGVSTGMLNHYYANRMEMLQATLIYVSDRLQSKEAQAIEGIDPGEERLRRLVRAALPDDRQSMQAWRVWIAAYGESVSLRSLRSVMSSRNELWYQILNRALEGIIDADADQRLPVAWQLDAMLNGLIVQAITTDTEIPFEAIEDAVVKTAFARSTLQASRSALAATNGIAPEPARS